MSEPEDTAAVVPLRPADASPVQPMAAGRAGEASTPKRRRPRITDAGPVGAVLAAVVVGEALRTAGLFGVPISAVLLIVGYLAWAEATERAHRWARWQSMKNRAVLIRKALPAAPAQPAADVENEEAAA